MKIWMVCGLLVTSCGWVPTKFDNVEYNHIVVLSQLNNDTQDMCTAGVKTDALQRLQSQSALSVTYISNIIETDDVKRAITTVNKQVVELVGAYSTNKVPSVAYCNRKITGIQLMVDSILVTLGSKSR